MIQDCQFPNHNNMFCKTGEKQVNAAETLWTHTPYVAPHPALLYQTECASVYVRLYLFRVSCEGVIIAEPLTFSDIQTRTCVLIWVLCVAVFSIKGERWLAGLESMERSATCGTLVWG